MKRQKGFTLVELLIAVVIIGILVSISIPIFTAQMHKAEGRGGGRLGESQGILCGNTGGLYVYPATESES